MKNPTASRPERGTPAPLGATMRVGGVNFSIYSHNAESVELVLFDKGAPDSAKTLRLDPLSHRTDNYWHVFVPGLHAGTQYLSLIHI